jgi:hypothetical protein
VRGRLKPPPTAGEKGISFSQMQLQQQNMSHFTGFDQQLQILFG